MDPLTRDNYDVLDNIPLDCNIRLSDPVVVYNSGSEWKRVPLDKMLRIGILQDYYVIQSQQYHISVIVCPLTLITITLKDSVTFDSYDGEIMIVANGSKKIRINEKADTEKRIESFVMTLRDSMISFPDARFIYIETNRDFLVISLFPQASSDYYDDNFIIGNGKVNSVINSKYNSIHPKTVVLLVQYINSDQNIKNAVIVGTDAKLDSVSGYDVRKSGIRDYVKSYQDDLIEKNGFLMPIMWHYAKILYQNAKFIYL